MTARFQGRDPHLIESPGAPTAHQATIRRSVATDLQFTGRQRAAGAPDTLSAEDRRWVDGLSNRGVDHDRTCRDLHAILLRSAKFEVAQRRRAHHFGGPDLDDIAYQAASDALLLIIAKAREFRGDSRFTTWATRFVGFEVRAKLRQHASRQRTQALAPEHYESLVEANSDPYLYVEARELVEAIHGVVRDRFSPHQRTVFLALLRYDVRSAELGVEMGLSANAVYQVAFRARNCLRGQLRTIGLLH
jgi:RNA polymerase sigma-70 factor (ECF subfamily)